MHPQLTLLVAQQHIADLHRAADHNRLGHADTTPTSSHAGRAPRDATAMPSPQPAMPPPRQSRSCAGSEAG